MPLIFHRFSDLRAAAVFADDVHKQGHAVEIFSDPERAADRAIFPYQLVGPVVLVERPERDDPDDQLAAEEHIERLVSSYGGTFAGT